MLAYTHTLTATLAYRLAAAQSVAKQVTKVQICAAKYAALNYAYATCDDKRNV